MIWTGERAGKWGLKWGLDTEGKNARQKETCCKFNHDRYEIAIRDVDGYKTRDPNTPCEAMQQTTDC